MVEGQSATKAGRGGIAPRPVRSSALPKAVQAVPMMTLTPPVSGCTRPSTHSVGEKRAAHRSGGRRDARRDVDEMREDKREFKRRPPRVSRGRERCYGLVGPGKENRTSNRQPVGRSPQVLPQDQLHTSAGCELTRLSENCATAIFTLNPLPQ
jgi:hypothetical protein